MGSVSFGYMDPNRKSNGTLFESWRSLAVTAFNDEQTCDLSSFEDDLISDCDKILCKDIGKRVGKLRDGYYGSLEQRRVPIRLPDIQSFFLYAFTLGVNEFPYLLCVPSDMDSPPVPKNEWISVDAVLARQYPIRGPEWLSNTVNREMPSVENVFCAFQNEVLMPIGKSPKVDHRLIADAIATSFLWAFFGGLCWLREVVGQVCECVEMSGGDLDPSGFAMYQVKKSMQMIDNEHIERVVEARNVFRSN